MEAQRTRREEKRPENIQLFALGLVLTEHLIALPKRDRDHRGIGRPQNLRLCRMLTGPADHGPIPKKAVTNVDLQEEVCADCVTERDQYNNIPWYRFGNISRETRCCCRFEQCSICLMDIQPRQEGVAIKAEQVYLLVLLGVCTGWSTGWILGGNCLGCLSQATGEIISSR